MFVCIDSFLIYLMDDFIQEIQETHNGVKKGGGYWNSKIALGVLHLGGGYHLEKQVGVEYCSWA